MRQKQIKSRSEALTFSTKAIGGATDHGETIGLKQNVAPVIIRERAAFLKAWTDLEQAKLHLHTRRTNLKTATKAALIQVTAARNVLRLKLGHRYSEAWAGTGFVNSLEIPLTAEKLEPILEKLVTFFTSEPALQIPDLSLTPAGTKTVLDQLKIAISGVNAAKAEVNRLVQDQKAKFVVLRRRIEGLAGELRRLLTPLDSRWLAFGFNKPGAPQTPDVPQNVTATKVSEDAVIVKWEPAERAESYRVFKRVVDVEDELIEVAQRKGLDCTIENLPENATVEFAVSAVNTGGDSEKSDRVRVKIASRPPDSTPQAAGDENFISSAVSSANSCSSP